MVSAAQLVSEIKTFLASIDTGVVRDVTGLAASYSEICRQANTRLGRCKEFLDKGLRSEAIQLAEIEPPLLDMVKSMQEVDVEAWDGACQQQNMERSPHLNIEAADQLKEAQSVENRLKPLLKRLRLATLSQVTIKERLEILRSLYEMDSHNPAWPVDIKAFETARVTEIVLTTRQFNGNEELSFLQSLLQEVTDPRWKLSLRPDLVASIRTSVTKALVTQTRKDLQALLPKLHEAHSAQSVEEVAALIQQWNELLSSRGQTAPGELHQQFKPISDWYEEQLERQRKEQEMARACDELRIALENKATGPELQRLHGITMQFDMALPEELERDYATRMRELDLQRSRTIRMRIMGVGAGVLAVVGIVFYMIYLANLQKQTDSWHDTINDAIQKGDYDGASKLLDSVADQFPTIATNPKITALRVELAAKQKAEDQRKSDFKVLIETLEKSDTPDPDMLIKARGMSRLDDEKSRVQSVQSKIDNSFVQTLTGISKKVSALNDAMLQSSPAEFATKLQTVSDEFAAAKSAPGPSDDAKIILGPLERKIDNARSMLSDFNNSKAKYIEIQGELAGIAAAAINSQLYADKLSSFETKYKDTPRAVAFRKVMKLKEIWAAYQEWGELSGQYGRDLAVTSSDDAIKRIKELNEYLDKYHDGNLPLPFSPLREQILSYTDYLRQAAIALQDSSPIRRNLRDAFTIPLYKDLTTFKDPKDGTVYYCIGDGKMEEALVGTVIEVLNSDDPKDVKKMEFARNTIAKPKVAPHVPLAAAVVKAIDNMDTSDWPTFALGLAQMVRERTDVDPIIRINMLRDILTAAKPVTWGGEQEIETMLRMIPPRRDESRQWMDPTDVGVKAYRTSANTALDKLPDFKKLIATIKARNAVAFAPLLFEIRGYASLLKTASNEWQVMGMPSDVGDGAKMQVVVSTLAGSRSFKEIGEVKNGEAVIDPVSASGVDEGSLIFFIKPAPAAAAPEPAQ